MLQTIEKMIYFSSYKISQSMVNDKFNYCCMSFICQIWSSSSLRTFSSFFSFSSSSSLTSTFCISFMDSSSHPHSSSSDFFHFSWNQWKQPDVCMFSQLANVCVGDLSVSALELQESDGMWCPSLSNVSLQTTMCIVLQKVRGRLCVYSSESFFFFWEIVWDFCVCAIKKL